MRFVTLKNGSRIRADVITAIRIGDARPECGGLPAHNPYVAVDYGDPKSPQVISLLCKTNAERDALADQIAAEIDIALRGAA